MTAPICDSHLRLLRTDGRTDGLTQIASHLPDNTSPSVTRTRTYGDPINWAHAITEAFDALEAATTRLGTPNRHEQRAEIHRWTRRAIYWRDGNRCGWCHRGFDAEMLVLDHIQPWAAGGSDTSDNLRTLCETCNADRSNYATDAYTRVTPVGLCDRCAVRGHHTPSGFVWHELDPESTYRARIFCGRCGCVNDCTDRRRVL